MRIPAGIFVLLVLLASAVQAEKIDFWYITKAKGTAHPVNGLNLGYLPSGTPVLSHSFSGPFCTFYEDYRFWNYMVDSTVRTSSWSTGQVIFPSGDVGMCYRDYDADTGENILKYSQGGKFVWEHTVVDTLGGSGSSMTLLPDGNPAIGYIDKFDNVRYAWFDGEIWHRHRVSEGNSAWGSVSVANVRDGIPALCYTHKESDTVYRVRYAWLEGDNWQETIVDEGAYPSLAVLPSGEPAFAYYYSRYPTKELRYAWFDGSAWHTQLVNSGTVYNNPDLLILPSGHPAIAYGNEDGIVYASFDGTVWDVNHIETLGGWKPSLAVRQDGRVAIAFDGSGSLCYAQSVTGEMPVSMNVNYVCEAWTDEGDLITNLNGPAESEALLGNSPALLGQGFVRSSVSLERSKLGRIKGAMRHSAQEGANCLDSVTYCEYWDPVSGECLFEWEECIEEEEVPFGNISGTITGTIELSTSDDFAEGSRVEMVVYVRPGEDQAGAGGWLPNCSYYFKLRRGIETICLIDKDTDYRAVVPVQAGETLNFEMYAFDDDDDYNGSINRGYEFMIDLREPGFMTGRLDEDDDVDLLDLAVLGQRWGDSDCSDPERCEGADVNKDGSVNFVDLSIFADNWAETF